MLRRSGLSKHCIELPRLLVSMQDCVGFKVKVCIGQGQTRSRSVGDGGNEGEKLLFSWAVINSLNQTV